MTSIKPLPLVFTLLFITGHAAVMTSPANKTTAPVTATKEQVVKAVAVVENDDMPEDVVDDAKADDAKDDDAKADDATPVVQKVETPPTTFLGSKSVKAIPASAPAESLDMTSAAMEAAMTDLMLGKTAFGATPMGGSVQKIRNLLTKTMMPKVKAAHSNDQRELNRLNREISKCGSSKRRALGGANLHQRRYRGQSKNHKRCRADEAVKFTTKRNCLTQQKNLYLIKKSKCDYFGGLSTRLGTTKDNRAIVTKAGGESIESYVKRISSTICGRHVHGSRGRTSRTGGWGGGLAGGFLDLYMRAKDACSRADRNWRAKVRECKKKVFDYNKRKGQCNQFQGLMDASSCKGAIVAKDACESYSECYKRTVAAYKSYENKVVLDERDRKAEWRGLNRISCLIGAFADGKVTGGEVDSCKKRSVDTRVMNIRYPKVPRRQPCVVTQLYPATGAYKRAEFAPLPMLAKGQQSVECSGMTEISLKPRRGSPRSCKCSRVTLNGAYSATAMVACKNCLDVRRSREKNSCPAGSKIFSPASRSDWQTFLASAGPLRAPNWIVDITRPQNGCGGCKKTMNSRNRAQKSWRTSDGSPWWLRSSGFGEPNGNYAANCFLNLHKPINVNSITFDDNQCHFHSKSYYCQLRRVNLKPARGSPRSCKCSVVDLTGRYTPGKLIKCEECMDVRKASQRNSCPKGMKIFSPTSRGDWKTFIKSAQPLRAPSFIIDVTRPSNGCGGCTKHAMNSKVPSQATWKTKDGSPWWLRSQPYGEPNGDYKANCFMDLWRTPHNSENNIQFNDHNCNYHSRSYYCQPIKRQRKPARARGRRGRRVRSRCPAGGRSSRSRNLLFRKGRYCRGKCRCNDGNFQKFNKRFKKGSIVRRVCGGCKKSHRSIYYVRITDVPRSLNARNLFLDSWTSKDNKLNVDFSLHSSMGAAKADRSRWTSCNYDDKGIGFPRDCGPKGLVGGQWNSMRRGGQKDIVYLTYPSKPVRFCVARINKNTVSGPFNRLNDARLFMNKMNGHAGNRQMVCEMGRRAKKDPHHLGSRAAGDKLTAQGGGVSSGFKKWWGGWGDIHRMNAMCNQKCKGKNNVKARKAPRRRLRRSLGGRLRRGARRVRRRFR